MTHMLRYPVDAPFMDMAHLLLKAREIAADPLVYTKPARAEALETLQCWGDAHDASGITSLRLSLSGRPVQKRRWDVAVMIAGALIGLPVWAALAYVAGRIWGVW